MFRLYLCISKQALVDQAKKAGSNHVFSDVASLPVTYVNIRSRDLNMVLIIANGDT